MAYHLTLGKVSLSIIAKIMAMVSMAQLVRVAGLDIQCWRGSILSKLHFFVTIYGIGLENNVNIQRNVEYTTLPEYFIWFIHLKMANIDFHVMVTLLSLKLTVIKFTCKFTKLQFTYLSLNLHVFCFLKNAIV